MRRMRRVLAGTAARAAAAWAAWAWLWAAIRAEIAAGVAECHAGQVQDEALARLEGECGEAITQLVGVDVVELAVDLEDRAGSGVSGGDLQQAHRCALRQ